MQLQILFKYGYGDYPFQNEFFDNSSFSENAIAAAFLLGYPPGNGKHRVPGYPVLTPTHPSDVADDRQLKTKADFVNLLVSH